MLSLYPLGPAIAQDSSMYKGGFKDGFATIAIIGYVPASTLAHFAPFKGGQQDGTSSAANENYLPTQLDQNFVYRGQFGDGFAKEEQSNYVPSLNNQSFVYLGKQGDGYTMEQQGNFLPGYLAQYTPYGGGLADGYAGQLVLSVILPLKLISFDGKTEGKYNQLNWEVVSEVGLKDYALQRGGDGTQWQTINTQEAKNRSRSSYSYLDQQPIIGKNFYRLKMQGLDAEFEYSPVVLLIQERDGSQIRVFPNPASQSLNISYSFSAAGQLSIVDVSGKVLMQHLMAINSYKTSIALDSLPDGIYVLIIQNEEGLLHKVKFVKQR